VFTVLSAFRSSVPALVTSVPAARPPLWLSKVAPIEMSSAVPASDPVRARVPASTEVVPV
jgi:hypothetical protein